MTMPLTLPVIAQSELPVQPVDWQGLPHTYLNSGELEIIVALVCGAGTGIFQPAGSSGSAATLSGVIGEQPQSDGVVPSHRETNGGSCRLLGTGADRHAGLWRGWELRGWSDKGQRGLVLRLHPTSTQWRIPRPVSFDRQSVGAGHPRRHDGRTGIPRRDTNHGTCTRGLARKHPRLLLIDGGGACMLLESHACHLTGGWNHGHVL